jgi:hypothetical protein
MQPLGLIGFSVSTDLNLDSASVVHDTRSSSAGEFNTMGTLLSFLYTAWRKNLVGWIVLLSPTHSCVEPLR